MTPLRAYARAIAMLGAERRLTLALCLANAALAVVALAEPLLFGRVVDALARGEPTGAIIALWAGLGLAGIAASVVVATFADRLVHRQRLATMARAFDRALTLPGGQQGGAQIRVILAGSDALFATWLTFLREQLAAAVGIVILVPTAIALDPRMAALLAALALAYAVLNYTVVRKTQSGQAAVEHYHHQLAGRLGDVLGNVTVVQSFTRLQAESAALRDLMAQLLTAQYPVLTWWGLLACLTRAAATITMVAVFGFGAWAAGQGTLSVGQIVAFVGFAGLMITRLDQLSGFVARIFVQGPTLQALFALLDTPAAITDRPGARALGPARGALAFHGVSFAHGPGAPGVHDLDFAVEPGQTVALVGPTGAGKSTTLALIQRLADPARGHITLDGHDLRDLTLASLRAQIAVVFQDAGLFNRSLADNIAIGRPGASRAEIAAAARAAQADGFITARSQGYDTLAGSGGSALSGGERQRIALARALLKDAPVLLLDEATSALDTETESRIRTALDTLRRGRTTLIIAHRLSTVAAADLILVLDQGRIVERGRFADLCARGGLFARLVRAGGFTEPNPAP